MGTRIAGLIAIFLIIATGTNTFPQHGNAAELSVSQSDRISLSQLVIEPFDYEGVQLLDGRLKDQFEDVMKFYRLLRDEDILKNYRERAGLPPGSGRELSRSSITLGQWLGAFARMYKLTGDRAIKDKAVYLMDEWAKTIEVVYNPSHYTYDKDVQGLVDVYKYIGNERALDYLAQITDWAEKNLDRSNKYSDAAWGPGPEWYTLSENLYRAYELTGIKRYLKFAKVWEYDDFWDVFFKHRDVFAELDKFEHNGYHAYSHVNSFNSAAMAYKITGEKYYLETIENAYQFLENTQLFATGGYGPEERLIVPDGLPETLLPVKDGDLNSDLVFHFETACGSWAGFKLARYLQSFTGKARYGDWIERLIYNGIGAQPPMNEHGMIMYGSHYHMCGARKTLSTVWFCCSGTRPLCVSDYHNLIYYHDSENLFVNLFIPSKVDWEGPNGQVTVIQETGFPEKEIVNLQVQTNHPGRFGLKFRVPLWAHNGVEVKVNNGIYKTATEPGTWAVIERDWNFNDKVTLRFDLSTRIEPLPGYVSPVAVLRGPVVMVRTTARENEDWIASEEGLRFPADWLSGRDGRIPVSWNPLSMEAPVHRGRRYRSNEVFRPFYETIMGEFYRMYFELEGRTVILPEQLTYHGKWVPKDAVHYATGNGSSFEVKFEGTALVWEGMRTQDAGIAKVTIDGKEVAEVDQYGYTGVLSRLDQSEVPFRWFIRGLEEGEHTIKITSVASRNPLSDGNTINVKRLLVY